MGRKRKAEAKTEETETRVGRKLRSDTRKERTQQAVEFVNDMIARFNRIDDARVASASARQAAALAAGSDRPIGDAAESGLRGFNPMIGPYPDYIPRHRRIYVPVDMTEEEKEMRMAEYAELGKKPMWEWSDDDLLLTCREYQFGTISRDDGLNQISVLRTYLKQVEQSEGFDVDAEPDRRFLPPGGIIPLYPTKRQLNTYYKKAARAAITSYNEEHETKFQVLKVEKVCTKNLCWNKFNLTFTVENAASPERTTETFQGTVSMRYVHDESGDPFVHMCRPKPNPPEPQN